MRDIVSSRRESGAARRPARRRRTSTGRVPCRLAVLGDSTRAVEWMSVFARPGDLIHVAGASGLEARKGEHGLVLAAPRTTAEAVDGSGADDPASVPMLVRRPQRRNPHARLLLAPLEPRREVSDATSPLFALAADGSVCGANRKFVEAVGRPLRELIGSSFSALLGPACPGSGDPITLSLADGKARSQEAEYARLSRFRQVTIRPLSRTRGEVGALLVRLEGDVA